MLAMPISRYRNALRQPIVNGGAGDASCVARKRTVRAPLERIAAHVAVFIRYLNIRIRNFSYAASMIVQNCVAFSAIVSLSSITLNVFFIQFAFFHSTHSKRLLQFSQHEQNVYNLRQPNALCCTAVVETMIESIRVQTVRSETMDCNELCEFSSKSCRKEKTSEATKSFMRHQRHEKNIPYKRLSNVRREWRKKKSRCLNSLA